MKHSPFKKCPRCGTRALEQLSSHSHCLECLYFESHAYDADEVYLDVLRVENEFLKDMTEANLVDLENNDDSEEAS